MDENYTFEWSSKSQFNKKHKNHARNLEQLFISWDSVLKEYEEKWIKTKDLPYVYNQQALVGLFAIAAKNTGSFPFLEFSQKKRVKGNIYSGRADLSIWWNKPDWEMPIEATRIHVSCNSREEDMKLLINGTINEEYAKVKSHLHMDKPRLALLFGKMFRADESFDKAEFLKLLLLSARKSEADFCAVHFCDEQIWKNSWHKDCPGIAAIGKLYGKAGI